MYSWECQGIRKKHLRMTENRHDGRLCRPCAGEGARAGAARRVSQRPTTNGSVRPTMSSGAWQCRPRRTDPMRGRLVCIRRTKLAPTPSVNESTNKTDWIGLAHRNHLVTDTRVKRIEFRPHWNQFQSNKIEKYARFRASFTDLLWLNLALTCAAVPH